MTTLFEKITSVETLRQGWDKVRKNNGMEGVDHQTCYMFGLKADEHLKQLRNELIECTYEALPLLRLDIPKPGSKKKRMLLIPAVRDRVVQSSTAIVLQPIFEKELENCTFAYRPGLSYLDAIETLRQLREEGYRWVVDADISAYFDNVDHALLFERFRELVPDPDVEALIRQWVRADMIHDYRRIRRSKGLPQGAVVSPMLANLFLDRFDEALVEKGFRPVRYADDFVIVCRSKPKAEAALELTEELLEGLNLQLHPEKTRLTTFDDGFRFLGSLFIRSLILPSKKRGSTDVVDETIPVVEESSRTTPPDSIRPQAADADSSLSQEIRTLKLPDRAKLEETALGRAFVQALDAEGLTPADFLTNLGEIKEAPIENEPLSEEIDVPEKLEIHTLKSGVSPFLRTLYVQEQGAWLKLNSGRFVITAGRNPKAVLLSVPVGKVQQIMIFGHGLITPAVMRHCLLNGITITLHSARGQYYGKIDDALEVDVTRERRQFLYSMDTGFSLDLAKRFVRGKVTNHRKLLRAYGKRRQSSSLLSAAQKLTRVLRQVQGAEDHDTLRGLEGHASAIFFKAMPAFLEKTAFTFERRSRRPPLDPVNAMLSFGYTLLFNNIYSMVRLHRLNPFVGFLHAEKPRHPALVSDLVEEFRFLIDRMVIAMCAKKILSPDDFEYPETGFENAVGCFLANSARKTYLDAFERVMHRQVNHAVSGRRVTYRQCIDLQVRLLADHLLGKSQYEPFLLGG